MKAKTKPHKHKKPHHHFLAKCALVVAVAEPLMTLPQIYQIWGLHETQGVSLLSWSMYFVAAVVWLFYGLSIKDKPVTITSILWIITEGAVVIGILIY